MEKFSLPPIPYLSAGKPNGRKSGRQAILSKTNHNQNVGNNFN